ncbi:S-layer homology domain-containing protein [Paenibacillus silviterrae]|uniref:S-layer homology domain-containing protein n=1 Tax=Paenibacillus silviterrae TaxID=3242194 RepID=UPI002543D276|nr:S-layer homology domain-containing protein [Paenibacillus chinjuensis]
MNLRKTLVVSILSLAMALSPVAASAATESLRIFDNSESLVSTVDLDQVIQFKTQARGDDGKISYPSEVTYISSNPEVATVTSDGSFHAMNPGTTVITATYGGAQGTQTITVRAPDSLQLNQSTYTIDNNGSVSFTLSARTTNTDAIDLTSRASFSISDTRIARVEGNTIRAVGTGTATLSAEYNGQYATAIVVVRSDDLNKGFDASDVVNQRRAGLFYWNSIRTAMGLRTLTENTQLNNSAQAHANYLFELGRELALQRGHIEKSGQSGFTGISAKDRAEYAGYVTDKGVGEVIHYMDNSDNGAIKALMDAPYYRVLMIDPNAAEVGIGIKTGINGYTVSNIGYSRQEDHNGVIYYPYYGQKNVPAGWYADETPNSMQLHDKTNQYVGYPITVSTTSPAGSITSGSVTIKDSKGNMIDHYVTDNLALPHSGSAMIFTPKAVLEHNEKYTVLFTGEVENKGTVLYSWNFTTESEVIASLHLKHSFIDLKVGESTQQTVQAGNRYGLRRDVTNKASYSSSSSNVTIDSNGLVKAIGLTDKAIVTVTYEGKSTTFEVNVKSPTAVPTAPSETTGSWTAEQIKEIIIKFPDAKGHWAEPEIAWAIDSRIIEGYPDGTFRPDTKVTEAEFIAFLLRALKIDDSGVSMMDTNHWSDGIYRLAQKYNIPLTGYEDHSNRDDIIERTKVAEIIASIDGLSLSGNEAINYVLDKGYSIGKTSATMEGYHGDDPLTRAEAVKFILNLREKGLTEVKKP